MPAPALRPRPPVRCAAMLAATLALSAPALLLGAPEACAQDTTAADAPCRLAEAEQRYVSGAFDETLRLASRCLDGPDATTARKTSARRLMILANLQQDDRPAAQAAARALLRDAPGYTADPVQDPPSYIRFITTVREELRAAGRLPEPPPERKPWFERRRSWLAIGGGLVVAGLLAIFAGD